MEFTFKRCLSIFTLVIVVLCIAPKSAFAHGIGGETGSDSSSKVTSIEPTSNDFSAKSVNNGQKIKITRQTKKDIIILGVENEPYAKISDEGAFINTKSGTVAINNTTNGNSDPQDFENIERDPDAEPAWKKISSKQSYAFHDHRIHYMGTINNSNINLGTNQLPVKVGDVTHKVTVEFFTTDSINTWLYLIPFLIFTTASLLMFKSAKYISFMSKVSSLIFMLLIIFVLELLHVIGYINYVDVSLLKSFEQSLYGIILLFLTLMAIARILKYRLSKDMPFKAAPLLTLVGAFGLIVDTLGEYQFFTFRYLPTTLPYVYSRISLMLIGLLSIVLLVLGIKNLSANLKTLDPTIDDNEATG